MFSFFFFLVCVLPFGTNLPRRKAVTSREKISPVTPRERGHTLRFVVVICVLPAQGKSVTSGSSYTYPARARAHLGTSSYFFLFCVLFFLHFRCFWLDLGLFLSVFGTWLSGKL